MISWQYFPKSNNSPAYLKKLIDTFNNSEKEIDSDNHEYESDGVLSIIREDLEAIGYKVE